MAVAQEMSFDPTKLSRYGHLSMVARSVVEGFLTGLHKSPFKGFSIEFAEHRQYYPGDEIRHIDWRAYGKTDRYYIKEYEEETNLKAYLLVDASGSMKYQGTGISKFDYARYLAASLAYLMLNQLDAIGLMVHDTRIRSVLQPKTQSKHLMHIIDALEKTSPGGETSLAPIWHEWNHQIKKRGMIVIFSDCFDNIDHLVHALRHFRHQRHEVLLFHILAPEELTFPFKKWTQFRNLENSSHKVMVDAQRIRKEYLEKFQAFQTELQSKCRQLQIDYHLMQTNEPVDRALGIYLARRQARK